MLEYMENNKDHYILTDGIKAGDGNREKFYIKDIINTPDTFNKYYDVVLHIRLEDKLQVFTQIDNKTSNITLSLNSIKNLVDDIEFTSNSCIVVNKPSDNFENNFINELVLYIKKKKNINIKIESNDILTDFHIMKNAQVLICSVSTISWCAALLSTNIKKCYMPDYPKEVNEYGFCKNPIENTILYNYL